MKNREIYKELVHLLVMYERTIHEYSAAEVTEPKIQEIFVKLRNSTCPIDKMFVEMIRDAGHVNLYFGRRDGKILYFKSALWEKHLKTREGSNGKNS
jgi:hypothetical protein